ncbi:two-component regulator propeller domain-containing protein [Rhodocytophaga rosea]
MEDKTGKLWIGTRGEAFVYNGKRFTTLTHDGNAFQNVFSIIEDKKGNVWLGRDGLWCYDGRTFTKVSDRGVYAIIEDKKGNIWTTGQVKPDRSLWELCRYDQESLYTKKPTVTQILSRGPALLGLLAANDGSIWVGATGELYRYDGETLINFTSKESQK